MKHSAMLVGCSSYYNRKWAGIFYPPDLPSKEWFTFYCEHFNTYELNASFYKFPTAKSLHTWHTKTPEGFVFSVKAPKLITHSKKFVECSRELSDFYLACREGLKEKLGCVLFQLPPSFNYTSGRLQLILENLDPEFKNVIEFRNESWWIQEVFDAFSESKLIFCSVNYPKLPTTIVATASTAYVRLHGNPTLFYSEYSSSELDKMAEEIRGHANVADAFVYFNNTASTAGILNALAVRDSRIQNDSQRVLYRPEEHPASPKKKSTIRHE